MVEAVGRLGAYGAKLSGQPAAYVAYFMFASVYITMTYSGATIPEDYKVIFYLLTGWFFANAITWKVQEDVQRLKQITENEVREIVDNMVE